MMTDDLLLRVEGLAGQLHAASSGPDPFVWWHLLRDEIKDKYRAEAVRQIAAFDAYQIPLPVMQSPEPTP